MVDDKTPPVKWYYWLNVRAGEPTPPKNKSGAGAAKKTNIRSRNWKKVPDIYKYLFPFGWTLIGCILFCMLSLLFIIYCIMYYVRLCFRRSKGTILISHPVLHLPPAGQPYRWKQNTTLRGKFYLTLPPLSISWEKNTIRNLKKGVTASQNKGSAKQIAVEALGELPLNITIDDRIIN